MRCKINRSALTKKGYKTYCDSNNKDVIAKRVTGFIR